MAFLNALFLAGLAGVALPVIIHLLNRQQPRTVSFGWVAFLNTVHRAEARRLRLREILLLILRSLLIALLAMAFARPFLADAAIEEAANLPPYHAIVIDVSFSMRAGSSWETARREAISRLDRLPAGAFVSVIAAGRVPRTVVDFTDDHAAARVALGSTLQPGYEATDLGAAFRLAETQLAAVDAPRRGLSVVSDHQAVGWRRLDAGDRAGAGIDVALIGVGGTVDNLAVTDVRPVDAEGIPKVAARVRNFGPGARDVAVRLGVDGDIVESRTVRIGPHSATDVTLEASIGEAPGRAVGAWVEIEDGRLDADDRRFLVLQPELRWRVLCVDGGATPGEATFYLLRALHPSDRAHGDVERPRSVRPERLSAATLEGMDVAFLVGVRRLPSSALADLERFVADGGGLFVSTGERAELDLGKLLPAVAEVRTLRVPEEEGFALITDLDYAHRIFTPFRSGRHGDFGNVRTTAYTHLQIGAAASVLMRFDDGAPALVEHAVGAGRVLLFTSALDTTWTDLPKRALFAPFVHESLAYLSGASSADLGEAVIGDRPSAGGSRYESPGLAEEPTPSGPRMVAVNVDPQESDLRPADLTALQTRLQAAAAVSEEPRDPGPAVDVERGNEELVQLEREQRWWWWLMWGVLGLALGEMVLANRTR